MNDEESKMNERETKDAMVEAWAMMEAAEPGLALAHTQVAVQRGGLALWSREVVCIVVPAEDGETLVVLFAGGDLGQLAEVGEYWLERGMKWVVWRRGWKAHDRGARRGSLERWVAQLRAAASRKEGQA